MEFNSDTMQDWLRKAAAITPWPTMRAVCLDAVDSTNRYVLEHVAGAGGEPILLWTKHQTAGIGRRGRQWVSQPGESLAFSIGMPYAPVSWDGLSLVVGLAVAQALHPQVRLKWPNDLWWEQRKLGGILIQTTSPSGDAAQRYAVVGVGLNMLPVKVADTPAVASCSAFLDERHLDDEAMLMRVVPSLLSHLTRFQTEGFAAFKHAYNAVDGLRDVQVETSDGAVGVAYGVDAEGGLLLKTAQGERLTFRGLEVSVRPVQHGGMAQRGSDELA